MPKTKQAVINAAIKMGYKSYDIISSNNTATPKRILVLSSVPLNTSNYYIYLLKGISNEAEKKGLEVVQYYFHPHSNISSLKSYITHFDVNGIIYIEFFNAKMFSEIITLNIPTVFRDYPDMELNLNGNFDILMSESILSVSNACELLLEEGMRNFAFIGSPKNCRSFYERYLGMRKALYRHNLTVSDELSVIDSNLNVYSNPQVLAKRIRELPVFPQCFICSNDYTALKVLEALKILKKDNYNHINVVGFDNSPESKVSTPQLSTINIDKTTLGMNTVHPFRLHDCKAVVQSHLHPHQFHQSGNNRHTEQELMLPHFQGCFSFLIPSDCFTIGSP